MSKMTVCKTCEKEVARSAKTCPHCGDKLKGGKFKFIFGGIAVLMAIIVIAFSGGNPDADKNINSVKNGYLGNYKTVTISKVLETNFKNADIKWDSFESKGKNIVEVKIKDNSLNRTMLIQFLVNSDNTFDVVHLNVDGQALETPYDVKLFLDALYETYAEVTSDKSITVDTNTSNDTLNGDKQDNFEAKSESKTENMIISNSDKKTQDTKKAIELLNYLGASIDSIKNHLGAPNKIDGAQSSELYDYGTFYFIVNDNKATSIGLKGSGATVNGIEIGMTIKDIKKRLGNPTKETNNNGYVMEYRLNSDAISIEYSCIDPSSPVNLITITDLTSVTEEIIE